MGYGCAVTEMNSYFGGAAYAGTCEYNAYNAYNAGASDFKGTAINYICKIYSTVASGADTGNNLYRVGCVRNPSVVALELAAQVPPTSVSDSRTCMSYTQCIICS